MKTAYATLKGFEVMRLFKKGQFSAWIHDQTVLGEVHLIHYLSIESEYLNWLKNKLCSTFKNFIFNVLIK